MEKVIKLIILACLFACSKEEPNKCIQMKISNSLPVQFWVNGDESFNNKEVCGITNVCFCQPFECDDTIRLQFLDTSGLDYSLNILVDGIVVDTINFESPLFMDSLNLFLSLTGPGTAWSLGANPSIASIGAFGGSEKLYGVLKGFQNNVDYAFNYNIDAIGNKNITLSFLDSAFTVLDSQSTSASTDANINGDLTLNAPTGTIAYISIELTNQSISNPVTGIVVNSITSLTPTNGAYNLSFIPSDYNLCNKQIGLEIVQDETLIAQSDCVSIKNTHACTVLINYFNYSSFDNLDYNYDQSPNISFNLRIPAVFFHEENTEEQEDIELSNDEIVRLYNKIEEKRNLQIGFMPHYMHRKLQLALSHDFVTIDGKEWIKRDEYKKNDGDRHYPLKTASVLLTDKNFIKENQL